MRQVAAPPGQASRAPSSRRYLQPARRRFLGRGFELVTLAAVATALAFLALLCLEVVTSSVSWQVVRPANSGQSFAWWRAPMGGEAVARLELAAQGLNADEIEGVWADAEARRLWRARNRVELMWLTQDGPLRWVVTNAHDQRVADYGLLRGFRERHDLLGTLTAETRLYLNPWLDASFLLRNASRTPIMAGLRTALVGTIWVLVLVAGLAVPLGVGAAIYLQEYAREGAFSKVADLNVRTLAGVPSIVYGILGLYLFVRLAELGPSVLAAALTLVLLILPVIIIASREAIRSVPDTLREASYALGATRWQTVRHVVLAYAAPGIVTGVILSLARAIGETAPLLLVGAAAFVPYLPEGMLSKYTVLPVQIYSWVAENDPEFQHVAAAGILTLLGVLALLYVAAHRVRRRYERMG